MKRFRHPLFRIALVVVSVVAIVNFSRSILSIWQKRGIVGDRRLVLEAEGKRSEELKRELSRVQSPEYVEREAREKLGMMREGETVVLIRPINQSDQLKTTEKKEESLPKWKQWWRLFF